MTSEVVRSLVVWVPDWPVVAAGVRPDEPAAVLFANRVVAASAAARRLGVTRHLRRRESQARCPQLTVLDHDPERDARRFETVAAALDALTPRIELTRPGRCAFPTRGPSRYFGGDDALADRVRRTVDAALADSGLSDRGCRVGVADGVFGAWQAARREPDGVVIPPGASATFLAPLPLTTLDRPELTSVLARLGLRTLGDFAALPAPDVLARFGNEGVEAHRLASGLDERPPATRPPPDDLTMRAELDPPADVVAPAAFVARGLAAELEARLASRGSVCTRVVIGAETEHGEVRERVWRHEGALSAAAIADRLRWQLDGWLNGSVRQRPTSPIARIWLLPDEIVAADGRQLGFWGGDAAAAERAIRALARVEGLLDGPGAHGASVVVPEYRGARSPVEQIALVPSAAVELAEGRPSATASSVEAPWPGRIPPPSPAMVFRDPPAIEVLDASGQRVGVTGRGEPTGEPARLRIGGRPPLPVTAWAGPWPADERWWEGERHRRRARFQLTTLDGAAHLVTLEGQTWFLEATYD